MKWILAAACAFLVMAALGERPARAGETSPGNREQAGAVNNLGLDLFALLGAREGNALFSPFSVHTALSMTLAGARGGTEAQMLAVLHLPENMSREELHGRAGSLAASMEGDAERDGYEFIAANRIWLRQGSSASPEFLGLVENAYGAGAQSLDFAGAAEESREAINQWVEDKTRERIKNLIAPGMITADTRMVLTNAVYFLGQWLQAFDPSSTRSLPFHLASGAEVQAETMHAELYAGYGEAGGVRVLELPYQGNRLSMYVVLPPLGGLEGLEQGLDAAALEGLLSRAVRQDVLVWLPKWESTVEYRLSEPFKALGMADAFGGGANFTGMDPAGGIEISEVVHKAFVRVDEQGTEAAAATAVLMEDTAMAEPEPIPEFRADHPFLYLIRDRESGTVLFMGRMADPTSG